VLGHERGANAKSAGHSDLVDAILELRADVEKQFRQTNIVALNKPMSCSPPSAAARSGPNPSQRPSPPAAEPRRAGQVVGFVQETWVEAKRQGRNRVSRQP
jgi:hypothetical protein